MIVLFDCNIYDKLIELPEDSLQNILGKITKIIMPQSVRRQLDMMIDCDNKMKKLSKINHIIFSFDIEKKLEKVEVIFTDQESAYFESLPRKMKNGDKEIALTAQKEGAITITNDRYFLSGLQLINQPVLSFENFLKMKIFLN
ncbi:MAG: hypothetical protein ACJAZX_000524 [Rickettsiales bacterium]|jgi:hypothetical protein